jgi:glycosyltransferase involved in cell wall biosynthesis
MRIGIGALLGVLGGPATYARELVRALASQPTKHELVVLTDAPAQLADLAGRIETVSVPLTSPWKQAVWDQLVPRIARTAGLDLYHGTKGILPLWGDVPALVTIHDLAVYHQPRTFSYLQRLHQKLLVPRAVRRAVRVITDSEHARRDVIDCFGIDAARVSTVPLAASGCFSHEATEDEERWAEAMQLPERFVLYAGTIQPRKNVELLVHAFQELAPGGMQLVIAGRLRPGYRPRFLHELPPGVRYLGPVSDDQLSVLYRKAVVFCSPSSYEGFGLSVLEAMQSGCPVVSAKNSSIAEIAGDAALLIPEISRAEIAAALARVVGDATYRAELRERGLARARQFSWAHTASQTLAIYEEALRG